MSWTTDTVELGDERSLFFAQGGEGPDLVLVHGALTTHHDWLAGPAGALSASNRVTVVDRPGHGASRRPRFAGTPRDQAAQIAEGLAARGIERALIVAHSFGGMVALALAERFPERVAGLVLVAPLAFPEARLVEHGLFAPRSIPIAGPIFSWVAERTPFDRGLLEYVQRDMFWPEPVPEQWKETFPYEAVLDTHAMVAEGEDAASMLPLSPAGTIDFTRVTAPAHVLTGTADRIVRGERQGNVLARMLRKGRLTQIEGGGHMLHHSHEQEIVRAVEDAAAEA